MKILITGLSPSIGGVETFIINLYNSLRNMNIEVYLLTYSDNLSYLSQIEDYGKTLILCHSRRDNYFLYMKDLNRIYSNYKFDAIWSNVCSLSSIDELTIAKKYNIPCRIIHSHNSKNMGGTITQFLHFLNKKKIHKYVTHYFSCSKKAANWMFPKSVLNKVNIINNSIDAKKFIFNPNLQLELKEEFNISNKTVIGHVGRFHFQKNHMFLLDIFYEASKINDNLVLILCGKGELKSKIKDKIKNLNLEDKVFLLEDRFDMNRIYQLFDLFLFPSLFEGLPFALIEAQAAGIPCLISDAISNEVQITSDRIKFMSLESSSQEWAKELLKMKNIRKRNTYEEIVEHGYDISVNAKKTLDLIKIEK